MKTLKPLSLSVLHRVVEHGRRFHFTVSVMVFVSLDDTARPLSEIELWATVPKELGDGAVLDDAMPKSRGEVLVTGSAHVPGGAPAVACEARLSLGAVDKTVRAIGDRAWDAHGVASAPQPFTSMPLRYTHAFGGDGYPLNPLGKGFAKDRDAPCDGRALPNLEDPRWPLQSPGDTVAPAGFAGYDVTFAQRASKLGTYDAAWLRDDMPGFARDIDWTTFNVAPEDQWVDGYFRGDEAFALENLHPTRPRIEGRLPSLVARAFVTLRTPEGERFEEVPTRLDTVHFFPSALRAVMIHRGVIEVTEDDAADVLHLLVGCERASEPRDVDHYRRVLAQRLDPEQGALYALRERDLMPDGLAIDLGALDDAPKPENLIAKRLRRRAELELEAARATLARHDLDPDKHLPRTLPEPEPTPSLDELPDAIARAKATAAEHEAKGAAMRAEAEAKRAAMEAEASARLAALGMPATLPKPAAPQGGPPPSVVARLDAARAKLAAAAAQFRGPPGLDPSAALRALEDPALVARVAQADAQQLEAYRRGAHVMIPATRHDAEASAHARQVVAARHQSGEGFAGWNLTGLDLSRMHLPGADFRRALMEHVDLRNAVLDGADLSGATLARADLSDASISGARFTGANLGEATFARARANAPVDFTDATFWNTDLQGATLPGATLDGVTLFSAKLAGVDLRGASARKVTFFRADLAGATMTDAALLGASFIECALPGADFSRARLKGASLVTGRGDDAVFRDADLENLRAVHRSTFARADFSGARMPTSTLRGTAFPGARFTRADVDGCDFSECELTDANFDRASAHDARFVRADLTRAVMTGAGLLGAILQKATLTEANLSHAVLFGADLARTRGRPASLDGADLGRVRVIGGGA